MKKHLFHTLLILWGASFLLSCSSDDNKEVVPAPTPAEDTSTSPRLVGSNPADSAKDVATGSITITMTFDQSITVSEDAYSKMTLTSGHEKDTITGSRVDSTNSRQLLIDVTGLKSDSTYQLSIPAGIIKGEGTRYNAALGIRFSTVTTPKPILAQTLCDSNATAKAKRLYAYLLSIYGTKTLSATMAKVNWNQTEANNVYKLTGKYPAINCYDFIQIYASPANWINYTNITPVTTWANAGGIVSLMWHFNVPLKEGSTDYTASTDKTTFKCSNVFTSGTWESTFFYQQMDKVCATLLKLQSAGIAALWRPFHEAAGNYYARTWKGTAWFWWGADGPEAYVKLWKLMFDYFQKKGIHNLIWIWTSQSYCGNSSSYDVDTPYYPGDAYVDIVGRDLYGSNVTQVTDEYTTLLKNYPQKMVTLAECGNKYDSDKGTVTSAFATVSQQWAAGCRWLYFMPWYDYDYDEGKRATNLMCSDSFWKDAVAQECVITRDEVKY